MQWLEFNSAQPPKGLSPKWLVSQLKSLADPTLTRLALLTKIISPCTTSHLIRTKVTYKFPVPSDYAGGDIDFSIIWTNDGGVDDNGKAAKWQLDYQVGDEGDIISGSHANSPKSTEDTYDSDSGLVEYHTANMTIAAADFAGKLCIFLKISAVTPTGEALTCEPRLIGMCFTYKATWGRKP